MTTTKDDGVKSRGWEWEYAARGFPRQSHLRRYPPSKSEIERDNIVVTPLISALDEADAVDGLCPVRQFTTGHDGPASAYDKDKCRWKGHAHADKLRGLAK